LPVEDLDVRFPLSELTQWTVQTSVVYVVSLAYLSVLFCMIAIERVMPRARESSFESMKFNLTYTVVMLALVAALKPLAMVAALALTASLGAGWIHFPPSLPGWCGALLALVFVTDLLEYWFHRAQHRIPLLWKMHEFHHSAEHFEVTLAHRHFWVEPLLKTAFLYPLPGVLLKCPQSAIFVVAGIWQVFPYIAHMNVRFSPKGFGLLVTHPQYHRVHHSKSASHYNKNLCALLPLWDVLFGTLHRPAPDEFIDVGLEDSPPPRSIWDAIIGPFRPTRTRLRPNEA
jgi:sterol desaturase/sphingolipid hydroxylase (fatty acid hydroxylase superfamily)